MKYISVTCVGCGADFELERAPADRAGSGQPESQQGAAVAQRHRHGLACGEGGLQEVPDDMIAVPILANHSSPWSERALIQQICM